MNDTPPEEPKDAPLPFSATQGRAVTSVDSCGERLNYVIENLPAEKVTLAEIRDLVGQEGLLLLAAFLTLVFLIPVSIPGVSTVFGSGILLIGLSRILRRTFWLPEFIARRELSSGKLRSGFMEGGKWFKRLERISRPHRMNWLASGGLVDTVNSGAIILGAVLLMAPFGLVPFTNTLPALALLFLTVGLLQRDGFCIVLGHLLNVTTIVYFLILIGSAVLVPLMWG